MNSHEDFTRRFEEKSASDRSFGCVFTVFFVLVGLWPLLRAEPVRVWALAVSGGFLLVTLVRPALLSGANRRWARLSLLLSRIMNPLVIGLFFYVVITPTGLLLRLFGKDLLRLEPNGQPSYWILRNPPGPRPDTMTNQF